jgi:hypothetical protein
VCGIEAGAARKGQFLIIEIMADPFSQSQDDGRLKNPLARFAQEKLGSCRAGTCQGTADGRPHTLNVAFYASKQATSSQSDKR